MDDARPQPGPAPAQSTAAPPLAPAKTATPLQRILRGVVLLVLIGGGGFGYYLYRQSEAYPSTDDAYIQANVVQIAPQISGPVTKVHVVNNQHVAEDAPLFDIDTAPLVIAVEASQAAFDEAAESVGASGAGVKAAAARVRETEAALANARREAVRGRALVQAGSLSTAGLDTREAALKQAEATVEAALAELDRAQQQYGGSGTGNARLRAASAALRKAQLDLSYAEVRAPNAGWVSDVTLREGAFVMPARSVFALVEDKEWWVDAHFKETDINRIKPGQSAEIEIDMYPGVKLKGQVESISAGSGATFSLLPPENATGNWVKVTQRYTVRVKVSDRPADPTQPLRVGASSRIKIDTKS